MTKRFIIREEVTDCNVGDVLKLKLEDSDVVHEVLCTEKCGYAHIYKYKIGGEWYFKDQLPDNFYTTKEVYPECSECGTSYKEK